MNNKLGLAIKVVSDGAYNALVCNKGTWVNKIIDPRHYLRLFSGLVGTKNVVTAMSFSEYGCYVMLLRDIPGHAGDCLSAWLFIPYNIDIKDEQVIEAYNYSKGILALSSIEPVKDEINAFFGKEYPIKKCSCLYSPSVGDLFGLRTFKDEHELGDILGRKRYQQYYSQFQAVFLLENKSDVIVNPDKASSFRDLTKQPLEEYCVLMLPTEKELSEMGQGTKVIFRNGKTFDSPISAKKGSRVELFARRNGFEDLVLKPITIDEDVMSFPHVGHLIWKKMIDRAFFDIRNHDGEKVEVKKIVVDGYDITNQPVSLPEEECCRAKVQITAYRYEPWESTVDLLSLREKVKVTLHRAEANYVIDLANGREAEMTLKSEYLDGSHESPLEGYSLDENPAGMKLRVSLGYKIKYWFYGILTVIGVVVVFVGLNAIDTWLSTHEFKWGLPPWEEIILPADTIPDATEYSEIPDSATLAYLNNNEKWKKDSLEKYAATQGLYDQLINYQFENLKNNSIDSCEKYDEIKTVADQAYSLGIQMSEKYYDDGTITIKSWIKKVKKAIDGGSFKNDFNEVVDDKPQNTQGSLEKQVLDKQEKQAKSIQKERFKDKKESGKMV